MTLDLQEISDRIEIQDALFAYSTALDHPGRRWDLWYKAFSKDAVCHYPGMPPASPDELKNTFSKNDAVRLTGQHLFLNIVISVKGDSAEVRSECLFAAVNKGATPTDNNLLMHAGLWFEDKLKRTQEGWRIHHRVVHSRWMWSDEVKPQ